MIEVLMVTSRLGVGGIEQVVTNIAKKINKEKFKIFLYLLEKSNQADCEMIKELNVVLIDEFQKLLSFTNKNKRIFLYEQIVTFLKKHPNIQAVHVHCNNESPEILFAAKRCRIPVICMHAHNSFSRYWNPQVFPLKSRVLIPLFRVINQVIPTHKIGCSVSACKTMFGNTKGQMVVFNGVDLDQFDPNRLPDKSVLQKKYGLEKNKKYCIFVGRLVNQKNPFFMLDMFKCLIENNKYYKLLIVGYGELEKEVHEKIIELELDEFVRFFPPDSDIPELLKASDYFVSPSLWEGLGIVFVEAQLMGLPTFASDQVPQEADLGLCEFVPLDLGAKGYADYIENYINSNRRHEIALEKVRQYDMDQIIKIYEKIYSAKK